jgi:hypothetical protein
MWISILFLNKKPVVSESTGFLFKNNMEIHIDASRKKWPRLRSAIGFRSNYGGRRKCGDAAFSSPS